MKHKKNKNGSSHVGFILSFLIFVFSIVFIYIITAPINQEKSGKDFIVDSLNQKIVENVSGELTTFEIRIKDEGDGGPSETDYDNKDPCFRIGSQINIQSNIGEVVKDKDFIVMESQIITGNIKVKWGNYGGKFYRFYFAEGLISSPLSGCDAPVVLDSDKYTLGQIKTNKYVFQENVNNLISDYEKNYNQLKEHFGVPAGTEFYFIFTDAGSEEFKPDENIAKIPDDAQVFSRRIPVNYINSQAEIKGGEIAVAVW